MLNLAGRNAVRSGARLHSRYRWTTAALPRLSYVKLQALHVGLPGSPSVVPGGPGASLTLGLVVPAGA